jgi:urease accessory protein
MAHSHSHDAGISHSHDDPFNGHGHSHDILDGPGSYVNREMPLIEGRDWKDRAFTIGIGGYVASTKEDMVMLRWRGSCLSLIPACR